MSQPVSATGVDATTASARPYTHAQRALAVVWGAVCHATFLIAISAMATGLFTGMRLGRGTLEGGAAAAANFGLMLQFAVLHSILLSANGRRWMTRLPLAGIAKELSTTTFALFSSLQILAVFVLWSPGGALWFAPDGWVLFGWSLVYASTWILLLKSMADSGLGLQTGALGWLAVWQNRRPEFPGYAMRGLYRFSRQPIYVAFTLILWTAPIWTLDHLLIALLWTGYCLVGPIFKERRFLKFYGDGYRNFSASVPYWLAFVSNKGRRQDAARAEASTTDFDVVIAGAGPVGMILANLLGRDSCRVLVIEPLTQRSKRSRAIGVTAPTLQILQRIGILESCLQASVPIGDAKVYADGGRCLGGLSFDVDEGSPPPVVSLPQRSLEALLEKAMQNCPGVTYRTGQEISSQRNERGKGSVEIEIRGTGVNVDTQVCSARWLVACDGANSPLRDQLRMPARRKRYGCAFAMADFVDRSGFGDEVRLFFTAEGSVETFPLPGGNRRWVVQLTDPDQRSLDDAVLLNAIEHRTSCALQRADRETSWSPFVPRRLLCDRFFHGRTILCGDAAHVMSPIGGHGMNVGIGDAIAAHQCLQRLLSGHNAADELGLLRDYDRKRRKAFVRASRRAALGMWMGSRTGGFISAVRSRGLKYLLASRALSRRTAHHFAMTSELGRNKIVVSRSSTDSTPLYPSHP